MIFSRLIIFITFFVISSSLYSQPTAFRNEVENSYNFWVQLPKDYDDTSKVFPVVLFLHGKSLSGNNLESVKRYGILRESTKKRELEAIVVAPQSPRGQSWNADKILNLVEFIQSNYRTDTNRLYVAGMSMGGYGTLRFVGKYPEKVAAAIALCGGGNVGDACRLSEVPLWIIHGKADRAVPVKESAKMVDAINDCNDGSLLKHHFLDGVGHRELARFFSMDELYDWLFMHSKADRITELADSMMVTSEQFGARTRQKQTVKNNQPQKNTQSSNVHIVKSGDTLGKIARIHGTSVERLCQINGIKKTSILQIGQKIKIP
jgi:predicted peptidase